MADDIDTNATVTVESGGRTLSGVGVSAEQLTETIESHEERHAPAETPAASAPVPSGSATASIEPQPKQTRGQARFSQLTQARKDAEAKAEAAEKKAADLEARLNQQPPRQESNQRSIDSTQQSVAQPQQPQATRAKPSEDDIGSKYPTYADFVEDLSDWKTEQRFAALDFNAQIRQTLDYERSQQALNTHVEAVRAKGRAAYKDFDAMLKSGPGTFVDMPIPAVHAILQHPQSEHLQYQIMKDGALAQKLAGLAFQNPYAFAFELAKLAPAEPPQNGNGRPQPAPPAPMQPVGSGSRSTVPSSAEHAAAGNYEAYKAARAAERKRLR